MSITCPKCKNHHELIRYVGKSGSKIGYFCDHVVYKAASKTGQIESREKTAFVADNQGWTEDQAPLREVHTPAAKKALTLKSQYQFAMTYPTQDEKEVAKYQSKLNDLISIRNAIREQIRVLESEILELNTEANSVSAKLSEKQTMKLI